MSKMRSILLDEDLHATLKIIKAKQIYQTGKPVSLSKVINNQLTEFFDRNEKKD